MKLPSLPDFSLTRPISIVMIAISMIGLGVIALNRTPIEFMPKTDFPFAFCYVPYPGASPEQVEREVAIPAEGQFRTIQGVRTLQTQSSPNGCSVQIMFELDTDMTNATAEMRDRIERLKLELPDEIEYIYLHRFSSDSMPVMVFALIREGDIEETADIVRTRIKPRLTRIQGVADVQVYSKPPPNVLIEFDQGRLRSANLGMYEVIDRLRGANFNLSVGKLEEGDKAYYVRVDGELDNPKEIADLTVSPNGIRLKDVAQVGYKSREEQQFNSLDDSAGVFVIIRNESESNIIDTCEGIHAEIDQIKTEPQFAGLDYFVFFDQSELIMGGVTGLTDAGKFGGLLALAVLFLFLRRIRPTVITACAIPTSMVGGLVVLYLSGMTINLATLSSMIVAIGLLVDNSIVVIENIFRHHELGDSTKDAARKGAREVSLAITAATCTTLVVFVPMLYIEAGEMSVMMMQFAVPVGAALVTSLVVALSLIPLAASRMKPRDELRSYQWLKSKLHLDGVNPKFSLPSLKPLGRYLMGRYINLLDWSMNNRVLAIGITIGICLFTVNYAVPKMRVQDMAAVDTRQVNIEFEFDPNYEFARAKDTIQQLYDAVDAMREELEIKNIWRSFGKWGGEMTVYLKPPEDYAENKSPKFTTEETLNVLWQRLPNALPGMEVRFLIPDAGAGQARSLSFLIRGDDIAVLREQGEAFGRVLKALPEVTDVKVGSESLREEMRIHVDEDVMDRVAVTPLVVAQTVDFSLRGVQLTPLKDAEREIPVWAQFREEDRQSIENLANVGLPTADGQIVPLNQVVTLERGKTPQAIWRQNGKNILRVTIQTAAEDLGALYANIKQIGREFELPQGYSIDMGDEITKLDENTASFVSTAMLASVLIYFVMAALFESYLLPISILMTIPLAFVGVVWSMVITNTSFDMVAFVGIILMLGLVVNNGIVIVDYINQQRRAGQNRHDAILKAGHDRLRPVLMTALTTILGCVPLAIGTDSAAGASFASLGISLIGGLTTGTVLTLYVVPLVYTLIDDLSSWASLLIGELTGFGKTRDAVPSTDEGLVAK